MEDKDLRTLKSDRLAIEKMLKTRGWAIIEDVMQREMTQAAMAIATNGKMDLSEIDFRRGAIWAGEQLIKMPKTLLLQLEGAIMMKAASVSLGKELADPNEKVEHRDDSAEDGA